MRIGGIASGMDTQGMLEQLMKAERMPLDRMKQQRQVLQWKQEDYRAINTKLLSFRNLAFDMRLSNKYTARSVTSSASNVVTATASGSAASGSYAVEVEKIATKSFANSSSELTMVNKTATTKLKDAFVLDAEGEPLGEFEDFTLNGVEFTFNLDRSKNAEFKGVYIDPSTDTLSTMTAKISNSKAGVDMFYDAKENKVFMSSKETGKAITIGGEANNFLKDVLKFDLSFDPADPASNPNYTKGDKAIVKVNGYLLENNTSNTFSFGGITFNVKETGKSTISVNKDTDKVFDNIKEFVDQYNALLGSTNEKLFENRNRDYRPLTDDQKDQLSDKEAEKWEKIAREGHLRNDTVLQGVLSNMRSVMGGALDGLDIKMLSQIGINTGNYSERGILHIDEAKLRKAIEDNPEGIQKLFAGDSANGIEGISAKLTKSIDNGMARLTNAAGKSSNIVDQSTMGRSIKRIDDRIFAFEDRLQRIEDRHWKQFTAMEKALDKLYRQGDWLQQQMMSMY